MTCSPYYCHKKTTIFPFLLGKIIVILTNQSGIAYIKKFVWNLVGFKDEQFIKF